MLCLTRCLRQSWSVKEGGLTAACQGGSSVLGAQKVLVGYIEDI